MVFGLFAKKDPVCGMKEEKGKGLTKHDQWFCSQNCLKEYDKNQKQAHKGSHGCCH